MMGAWPAASEITIELGSSVPDLPYGRPPSGLAAKEGRGEVTNNQVKTRVRQGATPELATYQAGQGLG